MIKITHRLVIISLFFFIPLFSISSYGAGYNELLLSISDSLFNEVQLLKLSNRESLVRQYLNFSEDVDIKHIADTPSSKLSSWYLLRFDDSRQQQIEVLGQNNLVRHLQKNNSFKIHSTPPNDSLYHDQWYHSQVQAIEAWGDFVPNDDVIMAIIDTGIDYHHPDLDGSLWINNDEDINGNGQFDAGDINNLDDDGNGYIDDVIGWDFTDAPRFADGGDYLDPDNDPMDEYSGGHGTKIAGIIAAQTSNSRGIAALTPGSKVMNLRAGTATGFLEEDDVARAVLYAIRNGAKVLNMSFGDVVVSRFLKDVIEYAYSEGVIVVASSGNSGTEVTHYPSGLPETISVGASDKSDQVAGFSNWGHTIDLVAPGVDILSTRAGGGYELANGTSFSAPMVTATVGLLLSQNPDYTPEQIRNLLKTSADDIGIFGWDERSGSGRLNIFRASEIKKESSLYVNSPASGHSVASNTFPVLITAIDPDLLSVNLSYGIGNNPTEWIDLVTDHPYQVIDDTITVISVSSLPDTTLILKLNLKTWKGDILDYRSVVSIDRTAPQISEVSQINVLDGDEQASLIEFKTDDITSADIYYRSSDSTEPFDVIHLDYETDQHFYLFSSFGDFDYYIRATNLSGLSIINDNAGHYFNIRNNGGNKQSEEFIRVEQSLPAGYMLSEATDLDNDGNDEVVLSVYDEHGSFGPVAIYEFVQGTFIKRFETPFKAIPRSTGDADNDGKKELLLGYGQKSYLLEAIQEGLWPTEIVWTDTGAFWASRIVDLDGDNINEIVGKEGDNFVLLESVGDNQFLKKFTFSNPSSGENQLGPPRTEVADLDDDGRSELYYGDYDGDLIMYENSGNDLFEPGNYLNLPNRDATNYFVFGDFQSSGKNKMVVGTHTGSQNLSEHQVQSQYWEYSILSLGEDRQYTLDQSLYIHGFANVRDFESGVNAGSLKFGEKDYLFLAPYPDLYIFKSNGDSLTPVWYKSDINTNTVLVHDFDKNGIGEFYVNNGQQIIGFEQDLIISPGSPNGFQAFPLDTNTVVLNWNQSSGADRYVIYRGTSRDNLVIYDSTITEFSYRDSLVVNNQQYYYSLQIVDYSYEHNRSKMSEILSATPNQPPAVDTLIVKNITQIELYFNEIMDVSTFKSMNFVIHSEDNPITSAVAFLNGKAVLLSLSSPMVSGASYQLDMLALRDTNNTPLLEEDASQLFLYTFVQENKPYVQEWRFENDKSLVLKFNVPMNSNTLFELSNYELEPSGSVVNVEPINESDENFRVELSRDSYGRNSGVTTYLTLKNLKSLGGVQLGKGNRIALVTETNNIEQIVIYPQPLAAEKEWLMFSNIAMGTSIKIFNVNGHFVTELVEQDQNGGVRWDLRDQAGSKVSSGIYIYYATFENQTKLGKFTIIK